MKRSRQISVEAVREEEVKLRGVGFVKEVGFKPEVKEKTPLGSAPRSWWGAAGCSHHRFGYLLAHFDDPPALQSRWTSTKAIKYSIYSTHLPT